MRVDTMLKKEKDGTLYKEQKTAGLAPAATNDNLGGGGGEVGRPASAKRKDYDVPSDDAVQSYQKTESSQTNRGTTALSPALDLVGRG